MGWNTEERAYFFGCECNPAVRAAMELDQTDGLNRAFLERYCSGQTQTLLEQHGASIEAARCVINEIARIVPDGDHVSPRWNTALLPLIVVGQARLHIRRRPTLVCRSPRFGLCCHEGCLHIWAEEQDIRCFGGFSQGQQGQNPWVPWGRVGALRRYVESVDCNCSTILDPHHPLSEGQPLANFLEYMAGRLAEVANVQAHRRLVEVLDPCRTELDEPSGFNVIYPKLATEAGDGSDADESLPKESKTGGQPPKPIVSLGSRSSPTIQNINLSQTLANAPIAQSMLQVLRDVAIARVRTAIPAFGQADLDHWIMSTGYLGAPAPHNDTADLFYVYAASLVNSGGRKPAPPDNFGAILREGIRPFIQANAIAVVPTRQQLASSCQAYLNMYPLRGGFANDINQIAAAAVGRVMMTGLLDSLLRFAEWLQNGYGGNASNLHAFLAQPRGPSPGANVFPLLRDLDILPWMGIATAANFVKDSQIPSLRGAHNPRTVAGALAGWFAKPDLHVARLLAYITGRYPQGTPQQLRLGQALALLYTPPAQNFQGHYGHLVRTDGPEMKVISEIHEWAQSVGTSALEIDRVLYLIGVRRTLINGHLVDQPWYQTFTQQVDAAVRAGVPRKS